MLASHGLYVLLESEILRIINNNRYDFLRCISQNPVTNNLKTYYPQENFSKRDYPRFAIKKLFEEGIIELEFFHGQSQVNPEYLKFRPKQSLLSENFQVYEGYNDNLNYLQSKSHKYISQTQALNSLTLTQTYEIHSRINNPWI